MFKRAEWRSGLTYRQTCRNCGTEIEYMDNILDFRPWYPDGFVYCSRCKKPLRHSELYAINAPSSPSAVTSEEPTSASGLGAFCTNCGRKFTGPDDKFCAGCGTKRV